MGVEAMPLRLRSTPFLILKPMELDNTKEFIAVQRTRNDGTTVSELLNKKDVLRELHCRLRDNEVGARAFFTSAGIPLKDDSKVQLEDARNLYELNPEQFARMIDFLYPDVLEMEQANADDTAPEGEAKEEKKGAGFNYVGLIGSILQGSGSFLSSMNSTNNADELAMQQANHQAALAAQEAQASKKTLWIVLGTVGVILLAAIIIIKKRK